MIVLDRTRLTRPVNIVYKNLFTLGVILLTEYHASSIRLRRVLLLRSVIRLSAECYLLRKFMGE